jgi:SMODS and SLOG-associating 2TM effector domain 1
MSDAWRSEFLEVYRSHRIADQERYYGRRSRAYERARRWSVTATAVLLVAAALLGALGTADSQRRAMWAFLAATVSAVATGITSYEAAFGFERYSRQYRDTQLALRMLDVRGPQPDDLGGPDGDARVQEFVSGMERLLRSEVDSWAEQSRESEGSGRPDRSGQAD